MATPARRGSGTNINKWVLVQWPNKERDVVHIESILCFSEDEVKAGGYVNLHWAGAESTARVIALASDCKTLEAMEMKRQSRSPLAVPSSSRKMEEDDRDYSPSGSSWKPSDNESASADSDQDIQAIRKHKIIEKKRRQLSRHSMKNVVTPKHRSTPIVSRSEPSLKTLRGKIVKKFQDGRISMGRTDRSSPALARQIRTERNYRRPMAKDNFIYHMKNLEKSFQYLINSLKERRKSMSPKALQLEAPQWRESPEAPQWRESPEAPQWRESPEAPKWRESPEAAQWHQSPEAAHWRGSSESSKSSESLGAQQRKRMNGFLDEAQAGPSRLSRPVEPLEEDHHISEDEHDRSDDDDLITNKFNRLLTKELDGMKIDKNVTLQTIERSIKRITDEIKRSQVFAELQPNEQNQNNESNESNENIDTEQKEWVAIGTGKTLLHKDKYKKLNWKSYTIATRSLLHAIFPREVLATHSLTGKKSPAFLNKPAKMSLDSQIVTDVICEIRAKFGVAESLVRAIITTKCADEAKMLKMREAKLAKLTGKENNENIPPRDANAQA